MAEVWRVLKRIPGFPCAPQSCRLPNTLAKKRYNAQMCPRRPRLIPLVWRSCSWAFCGAQWSKSKVEWTPLLSPCLNRTTWYPTLIRPDISLSFHHFMLGTVWDGAKLGTKDICLFRMTQMQFSQELLGTTREIFLSCWAKALLCTAGPRAAQTWPALTHSWCGVEPVCSINSGNSPASRKQRASHH